MVTVPVTLSLRMPFWHVDASALDVSTVYALAVDPDAAGNDPLAAELPPLPGMAKPSCPSPLVTSSERESVSCVGLNEAR